MIGSETATSVTARRPVFLGASAPLIMPLPRAGPLGRTLVASLSSGVSGEVAQWRFDRALPNVRGHLLLSPQFLDQAFLMLDQQGNPPTASAFHISYPVKLDEPVELALGWFPGYTPPERYVLRWASEEQRAHTLERWVLQQVHPAEWFYVEITTSCNLQCPFCPSKDLNRSRSHMSLETAQAVFSRIGEYVAGRDSAVDGYVQANRMVFLHVMGEPLVHPHLVEIAHIARRAGLVPAVFTNVTLLDARNSRRLLDANLGHVTLSLNAASDEDFAVLGGRGSQSNQERRVLNFLRDRAERSDAVPHVDIQYMFKQSAAIAGPNLVSSLQQVWDLYRHWLYLVREMQPSLSGPVDIRPHIDAQRLMKPYAEFGKDPSIRVPLSPGIALVFKTACTFGNISLAPGYTVEPTERGQCPYFNPFRQLAVFVDGTVSFCNLDHENSVNLGSLVDTPLQQLWTSDRMQRIREQMLRSHLTEPLCQRCLGTVRHSGEQELISLRPTNKDPSNFDPVSVNT
jgi:pyruvate-formate lyase-activating enzyme